MSTLTGRVRTVWVQRTGPLPYLQRNLPTGGVELHCPIGGLPRLVGPLTGPRVHVLPPYTTVLGVRFWPRAASPLLGLPADDLVNVVVELNDLWGGAAARLGELLANAPGPDAALAMLQRFLVCRQVRRIAAPSTTTGRMPMSHVRRFDHVGITVADLDAAMAFFQTLGLEAENRMFVEGEFLDTVIGIPDSRTEIVMLRPPDGGTTLELSSFVRPNHLPGSPAAAANELGLRNVAFEVDDLQAAVDRMAADGYGLVGGIGEYEGAWRMAYVRGPEGIIVSLAERIG